MPTIFDKILRDHVRYTGDGLPNAPLASPLPVGDPSSGIYEPKKKDLRDFANGIEAVASNPALGRFYIPQLAGAVGDGTTNDTSAWAAFQSSTAHFKAVPPGQYLVNGEIKRFDKGCFGNGEFDDAASTWDQAQGDRERHAILVHQSKINANTDLVSPILKTQTLINFQRDTPSGSFKHVCGAYHEATYEGYYNTRNDTNQNFTVVGASVLNKMAGLFGSLAFTGRAITGKETDNANIAVMGAPKQGVMFAETRHNTLHANGGYSFNYEGYLINGADETLPIPYTNNDEYSFLPWTTNLKLTGGGNSPISSAILMHGLGGRHGYYCGIVLGASMWKIDNNTQGPDGTVGISLASWRASLGYADIGIKFRTANRHTYFREGHKSRANHTRFMYEAGAAGVSIEGSAGSTQYLNFRDGADATAEGGTVVDRARMTATSAQFSMVSPGGELIFSPVGAAAVRMNSARLAPVADNTYALGNTSARWSTVYAGTGSINTSDERSKTPLDDIPNKVLDAWGEVQYGQFKFLDAVQAKGSSGARLHVGVIAQRVVEVFSNHGLKAEDYGLLCYNEWGAEPEQVSEYRVEVTPAVYEALLVRAASFKTVQVRGEDGSIEETTVEDMPAEYADGDLITPAVFETVRQVTPGVEAGSLYGVRYEEALCLEAAFQRRRADRLEDRQNSLEARFKALEDFLNPRD